MNKSKIIWSMILVVALSLLATFSYNAYKIFARPIYGSQNIYRQQGGPYFNMGMMTGWYNQNNYRKGNSSKMSMDEIKGAVENYIKYYSNNLVISDIFVFEDSDYYVSIKEKDTGKGAMELLVNPYTGNIYPEFGPNMMWNEKYGRHGRNFGMGMMGYGPQRNFNSNYNANKNINKDEALKIANDYIIKNSFGTNYNVMDEGHEFYGYYTFHVNKDNKPFGMLSVNYYTGDVWYHNWHGILEKIISADEK